MFSNIFEHLSFIGGSSSATILVAQVLTFFFYSHSSWHSQNSHHVRLRKSSDIIRVRSRRERNCVKRNLQTNCTFKGRQVQGYPLLCVCVCVYIDDASHCVHSQKPVRINARARTFRRVCASVETRVSTLARVISKYYRFPRENEPRFCLAGACVKATLLGNFNG